MTRLLLAVLVSAATLSPAWAERPSEERLTELLQFAARAMKVKAQDIELPPIRYVSASQLQALFYGDMYAEFVNDDGVKMADVAAVYMIEGQMMFLREDVDYTLPKNEYVLVHELVHHLQAVTGKADDVPCPAALEPQAYWVSDLWTMAAGHGEMSDPFSTMVRSQCADGW